MNSNDNDLARRAWNTNAQFWDARIGDGNDFFNVLVWPAVERLLGPCRGLCLLDLACGNGLTSRRLANAGAHVLGVDFSEELVALAKSRSNHSSAQYQVLDVTDHDAMVALGAARFDAALCNMALMDIADIRPLFAAVSKLLVPRGSLVFSVLHPCFNNPYSVQMAELVDHEGTFETKYSVKQSLYLTPCTRLGAAMHGQPVPHPYFHRPLSALMAAGFDAGFVLDGLEERAFPVDHGSGTTPLSWGGNFSEIPPVLVARLRLSTPRIF